MKFLNEIIRAFIFCAFEYDHIFIFILSPCHELPHSQEALERRNLKCGQHLFAYRSPLNMENKNNIRLLILNMEI